MSYTKSTTECLFGGTYTRFFKNGELIATRDGGKIELIPKYAHPIELTRAQGFRYWKRHFPERVCYALPALLEEAVDREPSSFGSFFNRNGEEIGYCG